MAHKPKGNPVHGWLILDKPVGISSSQAVGKVKVALNAQKAGHAGTLDPLASGILPIALGEATKTVAHVQDGRKTYRFTARWGQATSTDDREGDVIAESTNRPDEAAVLAALPDFIGTIQQRPPAYSAVKIDGKRAYARARAGEDVQPESRPVTINEFRLIRMIDQDHAEFEVTCSKGSYIRALARDLAEALETRAYVTALRRLTVGPFTTDSAMFLDLIEQKGEALIPDLLPIKTVLDDIPALALSEVEAQRLRNGQSLHLFTRLDQERLAAMNSADSNDPVTVVAMRGETPVALVQLAKAVVKPVRIFNLPILKRRI